MSMAMLRALLTAGWICGQVTYLVCKMGVVIYISGWLWEAQKPTYVKFQNEQSKNVSPLLATSFLLLRMISMEK